MRQFLLSTLLCLPLVLAACENDQTYPISGEECGPDDPVKTLDAQDCAPPVTF